MKSQNSKSYSGLKLFFEGACRHLAKKEIGGVFFQIGDERLRYLGRFWADPADFSGACCPGPYEQLSLIICYTKVQIEGATAFDVQRERSEGIGGVFFE